MIIPEPKDGDFQTLPPGTYAAICYRFIDRGTQTTAFGTKRQVMLSWEIPDELMSDGRPFVVSKFYTWSMHKKSGLRQDLEAWRGRAFQAEDFKGASAFNCKKLLGLGCMITLTQREGVDGRTFTNVSSIGKPMKGLAFQQLVNPITYLALIEDGWDFDVWASLSEKMKATISQSPEYKDLMRRFENEGKPTSELIDDEIPF